jgi:hypothetical protein
MWWSLVHSRTDHERPEGEQRYSRTLSFTSVLNGDWWSKPRLFHFTPGKETRYPWVQEAGCVPGPVWFWKDAENLAPTGIRSPNRRFHSKLLHRRLQPGPVCGIKCAINWNKSYLSKWISLHFWNFRGIIRSFHIQYSIFRTLHLPWKNINASVWRKYSKVCSSSSVGFRRHYTFEDCNRTKLHSKPRFLPHRWKKSSPLQRSTGYGCSHTSSLLIVGIRWSTSLHHAVSAAPSCTCDYQWPFKVKLVDTVHSSEKNTTCFLATRL